ncbi:hypothetical protein CL657_04070 [bacterium]|nr:hypothetical protein [bacterium]|tara:strand:+ start:868 stop:1377 length:510 start_codon:yes stop_codon:yes gene_type:complete
MEETLSDSQLQNALFGAIKAGCAFYLIITASNNTDDVINASNKKNIQTTIAAMLVALSVAHTMINHRNISEQDSDSSAKNLMWTILYDVYDSCKPDIPLVEIRSHYLSGLSKECNQFLISNVILGGVSAFGALGNLIGESIGCLNACSKSERGDQRNSNKKNVFEIVKL